MLRAFIFVLIIFLMSKANGQSVVEMSLYKNTVPNSIRSDVKERTIYVEGTRRIYDVIVPTLTMYKPNKTNGISVIICPGGGYTRLSIDNEGVFVAKALNEFGITAFVLKYRLPNDTIMVDRSIGSLQDAQQAISLVRENAVEWDLKTDKIGIMGFSAGGHLASCAVTHFNFTANTSIKDSISLRPDFAALIYPVISFNDSITHHESKNNLIGKDSSSEKIKFFSSELQVTKNCLPVFIVHAEDDKAVPVENSIRFYKACIENKVPAEIHLYPNGGHGFGLNNTTTPDKWLDRFINWLATLQN